jgi:hypothetical protein
MHDDYAPLLVPYASTVDVTHNGVACVLPMDGIGSDRQRAVGLVQITLSVFEHLCMLFCARVCMCMCMYVCVHVCVCMCMCV